MIRRPPRSTRVRSSAASDVYKRQDMIKKPELAQEIMEFAAKASAEACRIYAEEIGCDIVAVVEPVGSQVRPATYDEFVVPACQPSLEAIEKAGKTSALYICGDATKIA